MNDTLKSAYAFHRAPHGRGAIHPAAAAINLARGDVAAGKARWPYGAPCEPAASRQDDGKVHFSDPAAFGLRLVGRVASEPWSHRRGGIWSDDGGWFTDPHGDVMRDGSGLIYGMVYQLPGRDGCARFVAGYEVGGYDAGPTIDLGKVYSEKAGPDRWNADPKDLDAARDAAYAADKMAESAAEEERDYQTAWQAGSQWREKADDVAAIRKHALTLAAERRRAKGNEGFPTICATLRRAIVGAWSEMTELRAQMAKLASGDNARLYFWAGDKRLQGAFNEGACEDVLS